MKVLAQISTTQTIELVDPYMPSFMNRPIDMKRVKKCLEKEGGWNEKLAGTIDVAELPDGTRYRWDGSHRAEMFTQTHEKGDLIVANVTKVNCKQDISDLFIKRNKESMQSLNQQTLFAHKQANEPELVKLLATSGLSVTDGNNVVGNVNDPSVNVQGIRTLRKKVTDGNIMIASKTIQNAFSSLDKLPVELLSGVAICYENTKFSGKLWTGIVEVLKDTYERRNNSIRQVASYLKKEGGSVNTRGSESVALGLLKELKFKKVPGVNKAIHSVEAVIKLR